jgi:cullin 1
LFQQAEDCLRLEEERVDNYLHASTKPKLLREVENELLAKYEQDLLQKEHSGCAALLRDDKVCYIAHYVCYSCEVL